VSTSSNRGELFTFTTQGAVRATFKAPIATFSLNNAQPVASAFTPGTFPWIDRTRFLVEVDGATAIVDAAP
jgi:hypothetical protein